MLQKSIILFISSLVSLQLNAAEITSSSDKETQLMAWKVSQGNFQLELIQRSPQQTRSFFQARGFSTEIANEIATSCIFQTIVRNTEADNSSESITVSLKQWRLIIPEDNKQKPVKLKEIWDKSWKQDDISNAARVAFRWATFPSEQTFDPGGDYNWGMISFGPKPATLLDLHIFWKQGDKSHDAWVKQLQCPPDRPE